MAAANQHFDEVASFIESQHSVSCRWLANTLQITVQNAIEVLDAFRIFNKDVVALYLISGSLLSGGNPRLRLFFSISYIISFCLMEDEICLYVFHCLLLL